MDDWSQQVWALGGATGRTIETWLRDKHGQSLAHNITNRYEKGLNKRTSEHFGTELDKNTVNIALNKYSTRFLQKKKKKDNKTVFCIQGRV